MKLVSASYRRWDDRVEIGMIVRLKSLMCREWLCMVEYRSGKVHKKLGNLAVGALEFCSAVETYFIREQQSYKNTGAFFLFPHACRYMADFPRPRALEVNAQSSRPYA